MQNKKNIAKLTLLNKRGIEMENAFLITAWGMGGVFAFLTLLIGAMAILHRVVEETQHQTNDKIAIAIAVAKAQEK